jgi:hypothetical protein
VRDDDDDKSSTASFCLLHERTNDVEREEENLETGWYPTKLECKSSLKSMCIFSFFLFCYIIQAYYSRGQQAERAATTTRFQSCCLSPKSINLYIFLRRNKDIKVEHGGEIFILTRSWVIQYLTTCRMTDREKEEIRDIPDCGIRFDEGKKKKKKKRKENEKNHILKKSELSDSVLYSEMMMKLFLVCFVRPS